MSPRPQTAIKAILFDKDGTLIDFQRTWSPAFSRLIETMAAGNAQTAGELARVSGFDLGQGLFDPNSPFVAGANDTVLDDWARILGVTDARGLLADMEAHLFRFGLENLAPFPTLDPTIRTLHAAGYALGIATNDTEAAARAQMEALGLSACFQHIYGYDSGHGPKPEPGMILAFSRATGLHPSEIALVGDSLHDMHAGRNAGVRRVAVTTGTVGADVLAPHADHVFGGLDDLLDWLDGMGA
ncbi:HAD-IA family hydrolase [Microvirga tunisiensis]|uniref:HAD-IA family hydrolase n=2 Tax=Pannonibacter tanglangensis TaxID=2750084 RepID=A0ABW9ZHH8_9HYPH|nr:MULTISPECIES: HAD family hydrolase [unclassified Pannonibacter]NBN64313.1 HAD-IA family hydrolase [Pannonibacter sp. XCT-34]NBN78846.1 HAD-IA family hydrolase [Pannonibacter sp. XCT-53]